jgi:hypothetical protein
VRLCSADRVAAFGGQTAIDGESRRLARAIWMRARIIVAVVVVLLAGACTWVLTRSSATVSPSTVATAGPAVLKLETNQLGPEFAVGAIGLSTETHELETDHLSVAHYRLVRLMRMLGPSVLRVGGGTVDLSWWTSSGEPPPTWATNTVTPADLVALHGLLAAAGWRVLLGLNLGHFEPARAADEARWASKILGSQLLGFEVGNEPNSYGVKDDLRPRTFGVGQYLHEAQAYIQALSVGAPGVPIYGPALTYSPSWVAQMGAGAQIFSVITQHYYPLETCPDSSATTVASELLSLAVRQQENVALGEFAAYAKAAGRPLMIGETNSDSCNSSISRPGFASALWALDWSLRAASSGVIGLSFHDRLHTCSYLQSPVCASGSEAYANTGNVTAQPEYYGMLAARQLEGGRFVATQLTAPSPLTNLTTWATLAPNGTLKIAIDNFATTGAPQRISIPAAGYTVTEEGLIGATISANRAISLGDATVTNRGRWRSKQTRPARTGGTVHIVVDPATAVIVTLHPHH